MRDGIYGMSAQGQVFVRALLCVCVAVLACRQHVETGGGRAYAATEKDVEDLTLLNLLRNLDCKSGWANSHLHHMQYFFNISSAPFEPFNPTLTLTSFVRGFCLGRNNRW